MARTPMVLSLPLILIAACDARPARVPERAASDEATATAVAPPVAANPAVKLDGAQSLVDSAAPRMLIRTGDASVEVDSLEVAIDSLTIIARRAGGWIAGTTMAGGRNQLREATLQLRIPADRFGDAQGSLATLGRVEWVNVAAQDVGEEYVDLTARAANARRLESRLIELLARRTGKLEDVLAVERELARVREEIERYEGRLRYLRTHVATSSLAVRVHEAAPVIAGRGSVGLIGEAFRDAWRNFVRAVAAGIALSGVAMPLLILAAAGWFVTRRVRARRAV